MSNDEVIAALVNARGCWVQHFCEDEARTEVQVASDHQTGTALLDLPQPFSILCPTDRLDWQEQKAWLDRRAIPNSDSQSAFYYRAVTD